MPINEKSIREAMNRRLSSLVFLPASKKKIMECLILEWQENKIINRIDVQQDKPTSNNDALK